MKTGLVADERRPLAAIHGEMPSVISEERASQEEITGILKEIRELISSGDVELARSRLRGARESIEMAFMPEQDKRRLTYELYELEADLKLATLNS